MVLSNLMDVGLSHSREAQKPQNTVGYSVQNLALEKRNVFDVNSNQILDKR